MSTQKANGADDASEKASFRRRQYLVDRRRQLAATVRVAGLVLILLIILNFVLAWQAYSTTQSVMATNPLIGERMRATDLRNIAITAGISLIILAMVVVRSIMLTHRTAGAVHKVSMCLNEVAGGNYEVNLRLRNDDNIRALEEPFNKMVSTLRRQAQEDFKATSKLADEIEAHGNPVDAEMLRRISDSKKRLIS
jgi:nitrogen fixation/metabolism regulation signal transduction histidine kinase